MTARAELDMVSGYEELVIVSGLRERKLTMSERTKPNVYITHGMPLWSENDGQVSFALPYVLFQYTK
jgi:hypothetical protein